MLRAFAVFALCVALAGPAAADFEQGLAAYSQGDFAAARAAFEPLADTDSRAQFYLGRIYLRGEPAAMAELAAIYRARGEADKAFAWITRAANAGLPFAQAELGVYYESGTGVAQSERDATIWYGRAARGGSAVGAARLYRLGAGDARDKHGSVEDVRARLDRAHGGESAARYALATLFTDVGAHAQAFDWYRLAADQGHHAAEYEVGLSYLTGRGVARAETAAIIWFRRAVGGGHAAAMYDLANAFRFGHGGVNVHLDLALEWYENAVEDGYSPATHDVVALYLIRAAEAAKIGNLPAARAEVAAATA